MSPSSARPALPAWRRLAVRLALAFALLTFLSVVIVGVLVRERQKRELEDAVGTQLLNIARVAVLLVDPAQHAAVERARSADSADYRRLQATLASVQRAAATALAMQDAMDVLNGENAARGRPRFEMGIGLHSGEAVVGNIGSEQRTKYAVVGAAVNLGARVEGCTVGGQILVTAATAGHLADLADVASPITVELKGLTAPIVLY